MIENRNGRADRQAPGPDLFDDLVERVLDSGLKLEKVLDAACGSGLLVSAFRRRGIPAFGCDTSAEAIARVPQELQPFCRVRKASEPLDERYDLIVSIDGVAGNGEEAAALRPLAAATDALLFAKTEGPSDAISRPTGALEWMERFAGFGLAPSLGFSAPMLGECALLLRRAEPWPADVLRLLADHLKLQAASAGSKTLPGDANEMARVQERARMLEFQLAREREYLETLRGTHAFLIGEVQRLRSGAPGTGTAGVPADMDELIARIRRELGTGEGPGGAAPGDLWRIVQEQTELRAQMARLDRRATGIERSIQNMSKALDEILKSRIWQSLVSAGGFALRLTGRANRG